MCSTALAASAGVALAFLSVVAPGAARAQESPPAAETDPAVGATLPFFLRGVDLTLPAQEAFRGWPSDDVTSRLYWFPWALPTFRTAALFDRPMILVLHAPWSRPSQRLFGETFKDPAVLEAINEGFLLVVSDADRRPDIREHYQTGTWPVLGFLLPDGRPMISAANSRGVPLPITAGLVDVPTMLYLLEQTKMYYVRNAEMLSESAASWSKLEAKGELKAAALSLGASDSLARWLAANEDRTDGGFGAGPKFLVPGLVEFGGIRAGRGDPAVDAMARLTLSKMVASPLHDRRDGGLHRLAAAPPWGGIQYEKMLETNGQFLRELVFAQRESPSAELRAAISGTAKFLTTVLARPGGGFYLAQAADPRSKDGGGFWNAGEGTRPPAPPLDRLVLSGPNALAGAALLRAGALLGEVSLEKAGRDALDLVLSRAYTPGRGVRHVIEPSPDDRRYLAAQAETAFGFADAFESTGDRRYLEAARDIVVFAARNLLIPGETALRESLPDGVPLGILGNARKPLRENTLLARAMLRLEAVGAGADFREQAASILGSLAGDLPAFGVHATGTALAIEETFRPPLEIRIEGRPDDPKTQALRRAALGVPCLWSVVIAGDRVEGKASATLTWRGGSRKAGSPERLLEEASATMREAASPGGR